MPLQGSSSSKKIIVELLPLLFHALNLRAAHGVRGVVRGVAGVARATPIFQVLFHKTLSPQTHKPLNPQTLKPSNP